MNISLKLTRGTCESGHERGDRKSGRAMCENFVPRELDGVKQLNLDSVKKPGASHWEHSSTIYYVAVAVSHGTRVTSLLNISFEHETRGLK